MIHGLAVVDKDPGWTSHDVVARCRRLFGQKRVGHSGTLDPSATGVLLVGLGRVTRLLRFLTDLPKSYVGELVLGTATSTLDAEGEVTGQWDMAGVSPMDAQEVAKKFVGTIDQVPPMVSAVKVGGRRLHQLAREGVEVERRPREVTVTRLEVSATGDPSVLRIDVDCSSGTYIRSLAADIGAALGGGAHLRNLCRTAIGSFTVDQARRLEELSEEDVLRPTEAMRDYAQVTVSDDVAADVAHGRMIAVGDPAPTGGPPWAIVSQDGELLAVYEVKEGGRAKPAVVLASE